MMVVNRTFTFTNLPQIYPVKIKTNNRQMVERLKFSYLCYFFSEHDQI